MLSWDLDKRLRPMMQYLIDCRPHSVSMGNAYKVCCGVVFCHHYHALITSTAYRARATYTSNTKNSEFESVKALLVFKGASFASWG